MLVLTATGQNQSQRQVAKQVLIARLLAVQMEGQQWLGSELLVVQRHCWLSEGIASQLTGRLHKQMTVLHLKEQRA